MACSLVTMTFLLIFAVSFFATVLSAMSGAGSAMITVPIWLLMGFPLPVAQAASKVNGALWTPVAARNYLRSRELDWRFVFGLVACGLVGAYGGSLVFVSIESTVMTRVVGILILILVAIAFIQKEFGIEQTPPKKSQLVACISAIPLGFYEAFFGSGNGIFTSAMLVKTRGFDLLSALGYYYTISFAWCFFSAGLFLSWGYGDFSLIFPSSIGGILGAHLGSLIGKRKGSRFVKYAFVVVGGILGLKLALGIG